MLELALNASVEFHDGPAIPVAFAGGNIKVFRPLELRYETHHITSLPALLVDPPHLQPGVQHLLNLDALVDADTATMATHIKEMIDGTPRRLGDPVRPDYNPAQTTLSSRVAAKTTELRLLGITASRSTLMRKKADYLKAGPSGIIDGRSARGQKTLGNTDPRLITALTTVMARHTNATTGNVSTLYRDVREQLLRDHPGESIRVPSEATFRRRVKALDAGQHTFSKATTRRSAATRPASSHRILRAREAHLPGAEVQIDSTPFDAYYRDEAGQTRRANLTIIVDKATRSIIGSIFVPTAAKGVDLAFLLARCLVPKPLRPGISQVRERALPELPWADMLDHEARTRFDTAQPFIIPQRIMVDNGADYISNVFETACEQFGISLTKARVRTGTDKAIAEGTFRIIREGFCAFLPGYIGSNVQDRGVNVEREQRILDLYALTDLFEQWVTTVYQNTPQTGLRDPWHAAVQHTPNTMYAALFPVTGALPIPLSGNDYIALLPRTERIIDSMGIRYENRRYDAPALFPLRDQKDSTTGASRKWRVHYDPYDPSAVWVTDPETNDWIECAWIVPNDALNRPFADAVYADALTLRQRYGALEGEFARADITAALVKAATDARAQHNRNESRRSAAHHRRTIADQLPATQTAAPGAAVDNDFEPADALPDFDPLQEIL